MMTSPKFISAGDGALSFGPGGDRYLQKLSAADTGGALLLTQLDVQPGGGPPLHRHSREDELFIVLEGEMSFSVDGQVLRAGPGAVAFAPRGSVHTFKNCVDRPARMMVAAWPPGIEDFFRRMGEPPPGTNCAPPDELIIERIMKLAPEYGIEILGPSPL